MICKVCRKELYGSEKEFNNGMCWYCEEAYNDPDPYADDSLKKDRKFILEAVQQNGDALLYADDSLKKDRAIVLKAVQQNGDALEHVDDSLKKDPDILAVVNKNKRM